MQCSFKKRIAQIFLKKIDKTLVLVMLVYAKLRGCVIAIRQLRRE